jgi:MFS transporter, FSR family, fosmidomycin resistance protein
LSEANRDSGNGGSGFQTGVVTVISGAHFIHDVFTALLPPLLPLIINKLGLSLLQAGSLSVFSQLPSFFNPILGSLADRGTFRRALIIVSPGVTGLLMCLIGVAPSYGALSILLLTVGFSVAALHVAGPVMIGQVAGGAVGRGMAFFTVAGELARTVGPLLAVQAVATYGLEGIWRLFPIAVVSSALLWWRLRRVPEMCPDRPPVRLLAVWKEMRLVLSAVFGVLMARAFMVSGLTTFLPTFIYLEGGSLWLANGSLALLELSGAAGAFAAGVLSDRFGRRNVLLVAATLAPLLMVLFLQSEGAARLVVLSFLGLAALSTTPVLLAVTLESSGANPAAATGTYMMISFAARALILLAVGALGDALGLRTAFYLCAGFAVLGVPFVLLLPKEAGEQT